MRGKEERKSEGVREREGKGGGEGGKKGENG